MIVRHSSEFRFRLTERDRGAELNVYDLRTTAFFVARWRENWAGPNQWL